MSEQTFNDVVRESRVFYRRRLAERLAVAQIRTTGGVDASVIVKRAAEIAAGLEALELAQSVAAVDPHVGGSSE